MPVRIETRQWSGGKTCPMEIRVRMDNGCVRRYRLAEEEKRPKVTVETVDRVPEIQTREERPCRLVESWMILKCIEKNSYGGPEWKHGETRPKRAKKDREL